jgi:hypothetical protein
MSAIYVLMLRAINGERDSVHALRAVLKLARRRGLIAVEVRELPDANRLRAPTMPPTVRDLQSGRTATETATETAKEIAMVTKSEAFPSKYISAADLPKPIVREIVETNTEVLKTRDGVSSKKLIVYFRGMQKALVCNSTNFDAIAAITGEPDSNDWPGHEVELFKDKTSMGGKVVDCVRTRAPGSGVKKKAAAKAAGPEGGGHDVESENPAPDAEEPIPF